MRIGIDARILAYQYGGTSQYIRWLAAALAELESGNEFSLLLSWKDRRTQAPAPFETRRLLTPCHHRLEQVSLPLELLRARLDVLHSPDFIPPFRRRCRSVITVHDLAFMRFPDKLTRASLRYYRQIGRAAASADGIIAVSESTRCDLAELLNVPPERVDVVHHAPDPRLRVMEEEERERFRRRWDLPRRFFLWVGVLEPRKNLLTLLEAQALLRRRGTQVLLLIVGGHGWLFQETLDAVQRLRLQTLVRFFGPAASQELLGLYNTATGFLFPSLYEGFGFPPLEAMACGLPVISSNTSSLPEVLGEAAIYIEPTDARAWADAIERVLENETLRFQMRAVGVEQAARYSWRRTAEQTLAVYHRAAGNP